MKENIRRRHPHMRPTLPSIEYEYACNLSETFSETFEYLNSWVLIACLTKFKNKTDTCGKHVALFNTICDGFLGIPGIYAN